MIQNLPSAGEFRFLLHGLWGPVISPRSTLKGDSAIDVTEHGNSPELGVPEPVS